MKNIEQSTLFAALGDPVRLRIVEQLCASKELSAGEIARQHPISAPAISRHLRLLEQARLIQSRAEHRWRYYRLNRTTFEGARDWFEQHLAFWEASLDRLDRMIKVQQDTGETDE